MTSSTDPPARYRHPHLLRAVAGQDGRPVCTIRPFTGEEPRPEMPPAIWQDPALTPAQRDWLDREYFQLGVAWELARLETDAAPHLPQAVRRWQAYRQAYTAMEEIYTHLPDPADAQWSAQAARLVEAEGQARLRAKEFDEIGEQISKVERKHRGWRVSDVSGQLGIAPQGWVIGEPEEYHRPDGASPLVRRLEGAIEEQRRYLPALDRLAATR